MRKKIVASFLCIISMMLFLLAACTGSPDTQKQLDEIIERVAIEYNLGDTKDSVTTHFNLPSSLDSATITWTSSKVNVIAVLNNQAIVNRQSENQKVVLTANVTLSNISKDKDFEVTVLALGVTDDVSYTISWVVDGVSSTTSVKEGIMPTKDAPVKEGYTFTGWQPQLVVASANATYTAVFEENIEEDTYYTISWVIDGVISTTSVKEGMMPTKAEPTLTGHVFIGWQPQIVAASANVTYTAIFGEISDDVYYTISWVVDGVTTTTSVAEGLMPTKATPVKEGYTFTGWQPQIVAASANATYTASFKKNDEPDPNSIENQINALALEDICKVLPKITTNDFDVVDESSAEYPIDIYVDVFDWDEAAADSYIDALDLLLEYDEINEVWVYKNFFIYVYGDEETYGYMVYGINIYTLAEEDDPDNPVDPVDPEGLQTATFISKYVTNNTNKISDGIINSHLNITNSGSATFDVIYSKNNSTVTTLFNNASSQLRLYPGGENGGQIAIEINSDFEIVSITVSVDNNKGLSINDEAFKSGNKQTFTYNFASPVSAVTLKNVVDDVSGSGNRIDINNITITYQATENGGTTDPKEPLQDGEPTLLGDNMLTLNEWQLSLSTKYSGVPSIGDIDVLVIPVEIKGVPFEANYHQRLEALFNGNDATTGWQSVASYYRLSSYGKLNLNFDIAEKYTSINNKAYFESEGEYADEYAIYEAVLGVDAITDFSKYDYNNDGLIDGVIFVYSVAYSTTVDSWWAWVYDAVYFEDHQTPRVDGLNLGYYMWVSYDFMNDELAIDAAINAETYIHEMGHMLGQTDLYSSEKYSSPLGDWDMMDYNSGDHGPFSKLLWGWISPLIANPGYQYQITLDSYATDDDGIDSVILIPRSNANFTDGNVFDEYLLIIFYTPEGLYNAHKESSVGISSAGVVIYQVDARLDSDVNYWDFFLNDNEGNSNFLVQILEADKNNSIPSSGSTNIGLSDFLTNGTLDLSSYTWNQGGKINVSITLDSLISNNSSNANLIINVN